MDAEVVAQDFFGDPCGGKGDMAPGSGRSLSLRPSSPNGAGGGGDAY
jgi:hypothetical protein